jgi:hypothetical protein
MNPCACKPVMYLDGMTIKVLRIDHCKKHRAVDDLISPFHSANSARIISPYASPPLAT